MSRLLPRLLALGALASLAALPLPADEAAAPPADLELVPHDTAVFLTLRLGDLSADAGFKKLTGVMSGLGTDGARLLTDFGKIFGVAPADVERVTLAARRFSTGPVFIVRTANAYGRAGLIKRLGRTKEEKIGGKAVLVAERGLDHLGLPNAYWLADDRTIVAGEADALAPFLAALAAGGKAHPLADGLKAAAGKHSLVVTGRPELIFRTLDAEGGIRRDVARKAEAKEADRRKDAPPPKKDGCAADDKHDEGRPFKLRTLAEILDEKGGRGLEIIPFLPLISGRTFLATADLGKGGLSIAARADFASADDAKDAETVAAMGLLLLRESLPNFLRHEVGVDVKAPAFAGLIKQMKAASRAVTLKQDGTRVTAAAKLSLDLAPLVKFIAAEAPIRADSNNFKQIALAFHNHESAYRYMPARAICDAMGKPLLSWRVAILPYIEQEALYKSFKLDEPWDSAHNKKLLARMPAIYKAPARAAGPGETVYQVFAGPNTLYPTPGTKPTFARIFDGSSNTFLVAEAGKAVLWTKPDDIEVTAKAVPKLGGQFEKFFHVALCDGSVRRVGRAAPEKSLRIYIDPADGIPNPDDIDP